MKKGNLWVRVRPPTEQENVEASKHPRIIKFCQPGTVSYVTEILAARERGGFSSVNENIRGYPGLVEIECAGDKLLVEAGEFFSSWIRCIPDQEWKDTDDARTFYEIKQRRSEA
jgi:hypothetical protein